MMTVKTCCCGCSLTTGTIIIGSLYTTLCIGKLIPAVLNLEQLGQLIDNRGGIFDIMSYIIIFTQIMLLVASILLILGAIYKWWKVLFCWIVIWFLYMALTSTEYVVLMVAAITGKDADKQKPDDTAYVIVYSTIVALLLTSIATGLYCCIVVYSLINEIRYPEHERESVPGQSYPHQIGSQSYQPQSYPYQQQPYRFYQQPYPPYQQPSVTYPERQYPPPYYQ